MRKYCVTILVTLLISISSMAQWRDVRRLSYNFAEEQPLDTTFSQPQDAFLFHTSASFGKDWFGQQYFVSEYGIDYKRKLNNRLTLFAGLDMYNIEGHARDLSPRKERDLNVAAYLGMDYKVNEKLNLAGSVFYNSFDSRLGGDLDMRYRFSDNSILNLYFQFSKQMSDGINTPMFYPYYSPMFMLY